MVLETVSSCVAERRCDPAGCTVMDSELEEGGLGVTPIKAAARYATSEGAAAGRLSQRDPGGNNTCKDA
jgi:hypothetical protein